MWMGNMCGDHYNNGMRARRKVRQTYNFQEAASKQDPRKPRFCKKKSLFCARTVNCTSGNGSLTNQDERRFALFIVSSLECVEHGPYNEALTEKATQHQNKRKRERKSEKSI